MNHRQTLRLAKQIIRLDRGSYSRTLAVDYDPCRELREAAELAGIKIHYCVTFPMKTVMWINPGSVKVACGYRAPAVSIFGTETADA